MKVYIASFFADKDRVGKRSAELAALGITATNRWCTETAPHNCTITDYPDEYFRETAVIDLEDILAADVLILTVPTDRQCMDLTPHQMSRGGRHFETGLFYGLMLRDKHREMIILGARENVFHFLDGQSVTKSFPRIQHMETWEEVVSYLKTKQEENTWHPATV